MIRRDPYQPTWSNRLRHQGRLVGGRVVDWGWHLVRVAGAIGPGSPRAARFAGFGDGSVVCFPATVVNEGSIELGSKVIIAAGATISAGWGLGQEGLRGVIVRIGDRSLIGGGSTVIGHELIDIGADVWTGRNVHVTDMNHGYSRVDTPICEQWLRPEAITIGDGSWLGHGVVVLPGARIGRHVAVGANSVVIGALPDFSVAVGTPARVVRRYDPERGWLAVARDGTETPDDPDVRQLEMLAEDLAHCSDEERAGVAELATLLRHSAAASRVGPAPDAPAGEGVIGASLR